MQRDPTAILGLGNCLCGDDGVGLAVLDRLRECPLPEGVALVDGGTGGLEVTLEFQGRATVIVIDAARFDGSPGELRRFDLLASDTGRTHWGAGHAHGLGAAIELARALSLLPKRLVLYAVEPATLDTPMQLSPAVQKAVPLAVAAILAELLQQDSQFTG
jgi:hydrogenase maturation protease